MGGGVRMAELVYFWQNLLKFADILVLCVL